jgi:hypothetical protein
VIGATGVLGGALAEGLAEALRRFDMLHPYATGCVAQFEDIISEPSEGRMIRKRAGAAPTFANRTPIPRKKN